VNSDVKCPLYNQAGCAARKNYKGFGFISREPLVDGYVAIDRAMKMQKHGRKLKGNRAWLKDETNASFSTGDR
jgi:hypothetical protein